MRSGKFRFRHFLFEPPDNVIGFEFVSCRFIWIDFRVALTFRLILITDLCVGCCAFDVYENYRLRPEGCVNVWDRWLADTCVGDVCACSSTWLPLPVLVGPSSTMDELPGANEAVANSVVSANRRRVWVTFSMTMPGFRSRFICGRLAAFALRARMFNACENRKILKSPTTGLLLDNNSTLLTTLVINDNDYRLLSPLSSRRQWRI